MKTIVVEVAATPASHERGLMDRTASGGMLFLFDGMTRTPFWNARTLLPLDLFFIDRDGFVVTRHAMRTIVETQNVLTPYYASRPYAAALELPRGMAPFVQMIQIKSIDRPRGTAVVTLL